MPQGAFYAYPNVSAAFTGGITNALQFAEKLLAEEFVAVVPGEAFGTQRACPDFLRDFDEGAGARAGSAAEVHRGARLEPGVMRRLTPSFREKVWGSTRLGPWFPDSEHRQNRRSVV